MTENLPDLQVHVIEVVSKCRFVIETEFTNFAYKPKINNVYLIIVSNILEFYLKVERSLKGHVIGMACNTIPMGSFIVSDNLMLLLNRSCSLLELPSLKETNGLSGAFSRRKLFKTSPNP